MRKHSPEMRRGARKIPDGFGVAVSTHLCVSVVVRLSSTPILGDKERAFFWLEKCYQGREHDLVFSKVWPMFNSLHSDPRCPRVMKR